MSILLRKSLPSLYESINNDDREGIVKLYEVSSRTSSLIYREMVKDIKKTHPAGNQYISLSIKQHQDFERYMEWKDLAEIIRCTQILKEGEAYRPLLEARGLDPTKMAHAFCGQKTG